MKRQPQIGDFVKYTWSPKHVEGLYGLVFRKELEDSAINDGQVVWFGEKTHCQKHKLTYKEFSISGILYKENRKDCRVVIAPKKILKRIQGALNFVAKEEYPRIDNLTYIELLAKSKGLI